MTTDNHTRPTTTPDGPFTTETEARHSPFVRRLHALPDLTLAPSLRHDHLLRAITTTDVTLGAFDARIVAWLARTWEATTVAVLAGLITRAHHAGKTTGTAEARLHADLSTRSRNPLDTTPGSDFTDR